MKLTNGFLGALLLGALMTPVACADDRGALPRGGPMGPEPPGEEPGPGPGPRPEPTPAGVVWFHSIDMVHQPVATPLYRGDRATGTKTEVVAREGTADTLRHHAGHVAVEGNRLFFASTAGTGGDLNLWAASLDGSSAQQVSMFGFPFFGNIRDIDAAGGRLAVVSEVRSNEFDPRLEIALGTAGAFSMVSHGDLIQSESVFLLGGGEVLTSLQLSLGEAIVAISAGSEQDIFQTPSDSANMNAEGVVGDWVVILAQNLVPSVPTLRPQVFAVNRRTQQVRTLSPEGAADAVVCGDLIGITYSSIAFTRLLEPAVSLFPAAVRELVMNDGFIPDTFIEWRDIDGNIVLPKSEFGVPVVDPFCN